MTLQKNRFFGKPFEFDMSGIRFVFEGDRFDVVKVFSVFEPSPAAEAGIQAGDEIAEIDGRKVGTFTRESLGAYLQRDGERVRLRIKQGGDEKDITIRLRRLV
jgi:S1-C subfamily serine protease